MWPVTPSYSVLENRSFLTNSLMSGLKSVYFNLVMTLCYRTVSVRSTIFYCMSWKSLLVVRVFLGEKIVILAVEIRKALTLWVSSPTGYKIQSGQTANDSSC